MNHNKLNLQVGETVILDNRYEVFIVGFTPNFVFATVKNDEKTDDADCWQVMTNRLKPKKNMIDTNSGVEVTPIYPDTTPRDGFTTEYDNTMITHNNTPVVVGTVTGNFQEEGLCYDPEKFTVTEKGLSTEYNVALIGFGKISHHLFIAGDMLYVKSIDEVPAGYTPYFLVEDEFSQDKTYLIKNHRNDFVPSQVAMLAEAANPSTKYFGSKLNTEPSKHHNKKYSNVKNNGKRKKKAKNGR